MYCYWNRHIYSGMWSNNCHIGSKVIKYNHSHHQLYSHDHRHLQRQDLHCPSYCRTNLHRSIQSIWSCNGRLIPNRVPSHLRHRCSLFIWHHPFICHPRFELQHQHQWFREAKVHCYKASNITVKLQLFLHLHFVWGSNSIKYSAQLHLWRAKRCHRRCFDKCCRCIYICDSDLTSQCMPNYLWSQELTLWICLRRRVANMDHSKH